MKPKWYLIPQMHIWSAIIFHLDTFTSKSSISSSCFLSTVTPTLAVTSFILACPRSSHYVTVMFIFTSQPVQIYGQHIKDVKILAVQLFVSVAIFERASQGSCLFQFVKVWEDLVFFGSVDWPGRGKAGGVGSTAGALGLPPSYLPMCLPHMSPLPPSANLPAQACPSTAQCAGDPCNLHSPIHPGKVDSKAGAGKKRNMRNNLGRGLTCASTGPGKVMPPPQNMKNVICILLQLSQGPAAGIFVSCSIQTLHHCTCWLTVSSKV